MTGRADFRSPWTRAGYVAAVETARRVLRLLRLPEAPLIRRLVAAQNGRVRRHLARHPARSVLLILPRCVKRPGCPVDVRGELSVCRDCRACPLGEIARRAAARDVRALVAFRSHLAFAMARRERPDVIIAAACEDRLVKALRSVPEVPALLSPLVAMRKPCVGAEFDLPWLLAQVELACGPAAAPPAAARPAPARAAAG